MNYLFPLPDPAWSLEHYLNQFHPFTREVLINLYAIWAEHNQTFFGGQLKPPFLQILVPFKPGRGPAGHCGLHPYVPGRVEIGIDEEFAESVRNVPAPGDRDAWSQWEMTRDVLLHECIHQWHFEVTGRGDARQHGHGPAFAHTCNVIGRKLGLEPVTYPRRIHMPAPDCRSWPHNVNRRSGAYSPGAGQAVDLWLTRRKCRRDVRRLPQSIPTLDQLRDDRPSAESEDVQFEPVPWDDEPGNDTPS